MFAILFHHTFSEPVLFSSFRSLSTQHMCRLSLTLTRRRKVSSVFVAVNSSRSWTTLTPTGGKEAAMAKQACSRATTSSPSVGTCKWSRPYTRRPGSPTTTTATITIFIIIVLDIISSPSPSSPLAIQTLSPLESHPSPPVFLVKPHNKRSRQKEMQKKTDCESWRNKGEVVQHYCVAGRWV